MHKQTLKPMCFVSALIATCAAAVGAPSGLNVIPTADVLDRGVVSMECESDGTGRPWGDDTSSFTLLQYGLGGGVELGIDRCTSDPETWLNLKWRFRDEAGAAPAIAIGVQAIADGGRPQPFVAATMGWDPMRLHTGVVRMEGRNRWMIGADCPLCDRLTLQADYISGRGNMSSFGVAVSLTDSLSLTLARSVGNSADVGNGHIVNVAWSRPVSLR